MCTFSLLKQHFLYLWFSHQPDQTVHNLNIIRLGRDFTVFFDFSLTRTARDLVVVTPRSVRLTDC